LTFRRDLYYEQTSTVVKSKQAQRHRIVATYAQSFAPWQQATIEIMLAISLTIACSRYTYDGVVLRAHPVRGESHNQRNTTGKVATVSIWFITAPVSFAF